MTTADAARRPRRAARGSRLGRSLRPRLRRWSADPTRSRSSRRWCRPTSTRWPTATPCTACSSRRRASSTSTSGSLRVATRRGSTASPGLGAQLATSLTRFQIRVKAEIVDRTGEFGMLVARRRADDGADVARRCARASPTAWGHDLDRSARRAARRSATRASTRSAFEAWRIERGDPACSRPTSTTRTIPQEAFLEQDAVSFTKGCFLGQELVCRIDSRGHVNRFLRRFADIDGDWPPVGAEVVVDGKVVGTLTSVAPAELPTGALGYVRREVEPPARGRAALGRRQRPRRRRCRQLTARGASPRSACPRRRSARPGRRRPSPPRARARWRGRCRCRPCGPGTVRDV